MEASRSCNFSNKEKQQKPELQNTKLLGSSSEDDISLLNEPNKTTFGGFTEAKRAYENGTDEIRHLLQQECSLIYECKTCRNLFRSLLNFFKHKRSYCKQTIQQHFPDNLDDKSNILLHLSESQNAWLGKGNGATIASANADVAKPNNYMSKPIHSALSASLNSNMLEKNALNSVASKMQLECAPIKTQAVNQDFNLQSGNSAKPEVDQTQHPTKCTTSNANGKNSNSSKVLPNDTYAFTTTKDLKYNCEICNINFKTKRFLAAHFQEKHTSSMDVFQCPVCSITFLQLTAVVQHLADEHKKPLRRIHKMRDAILQGRIQIDDMHLKAPSRELKRLQLSDCTNVENGTEANCKANETKATCKLCNRKFENHALYSTHLLNCSSKNISQKNTAKETSIDSSQIVSKPLKLLPLKVLQSPVTGVERNDTVVDTGVHLNNNKSIPNMKSEKDLSCDNKKMLNSLKTEVIDGSLSTVNEIIDILTPDITPNFKTETESTNAADCESVKKLKSKQNNNSDVTPVNTLTCICKLCKKQFNALSNLRRHISMFHYRSSRFGCTLCDYRAFRRYDIVNHLGFVHKMTGERELLALKYVTVNDVSYSKDDMDSDMLVITNTDTNLLKTPHDDTDLNSSEGKYDENDSNNSTNANQSKVKRKQTRKSISHTNNGDPQRRPIRNRIKAESKDFLYDFSKTQQQPKEEKVVSDDSPLIGKRRYSSHKNSQGVDALPVKISRYMLRTGPLLPPNLELVKGAADRLCKHMVSRGLAAPSRVPELPAERPQIRPRLISTLRTDVPAVPIIETSGLEAHSLKPKLFDDSFLEKFATSSNPSFRMKPPLLNVEHSPLNAILQRFDATLQHNGICGN